MEAEPKPRLAHRKHRRERAHRVPVEESDTEPEQGGEDISPTRGVKDRGRSKPRKKKNSPGTYEEDIIDGFAIVSFKSIDDLEKFTAGKLTCKTPSTKTKRNSSLSPARHKPKSNVRTKKKKKKQTRNNIQKTRRYDNSAADNSGSSGETTDNLDTSEYIINGPKKPSLSDGSTRSNSGAGYLCDSESGDERISDGSLDIFTTKPLNTSIKCEPVVPCSVSSVVSLQPPPITTACSVTITTSDATVTTATTTTSCLSLATTLSTTSVIVTTASPIVQTTTTTSNNIHLHPHQHHNQHHHQQQQQQVHQAPPPVSVTATTALTLSQTFTNSQPVTASIDSHKYHQQQPLPATVDSCIKKHSPLLNHQHHHNHHQNHLQQSYLNHPQTRPVNLEKPVNNVNSGNVNSGRNSPVEKFVDKKPRLSNSPLTVTKRPPSSPQISRHSRSPPRHKPNPLPPPLTSVPNSSSASPFRVSSAQSLPPSSSSVASSSVISREPKRTPPLSRPPSHRETPHDRDSYPQVLPPSLGAAKSFFPPGFQGHGATPSLYSPLGPSPGLHPLHSTPSHSVSYPGPGLTSLHHQHLPSSTHPAQPAHNMFAPPLPLGPPTGPLPGAAPATPAAHLQPESPLSIANPDLLREELNRRFLASQDRSSLLQGVAPFLRADIHQHMHQHQHQHTHQHTYTGLPPPPISASSIVPTPTPHMYEKISSNPFFRPGLPPGIAEPAPRLLPNGKDKPVIPQHPRSAIPGLPGYPSLLLNPGAPGHSDPLSSGIHGAFQPKGLSSLHPVGGPGPAVFMHGRDIEKPQSHIPTAQSSTQTSSKKPGKWCAVHVRIAWEIYRQQQKLPSDKGSESRSLDPLRPPSHLLPGSSKGSPHNLLNSSSHIGAPSFPRPSPYSIGTSLPIGIGNGIPTSREAPSIPSGSQEWNILHRTPPTFPTPPGWAAKAEVFDAPQEKGNGIPTSREAPSIPSGSQEWNILHRTPPTFPTPPAWAAKAEVFDAPQEKGNGIPTSREAPSIPSGSQEWNILHRTPPTFPTPPAWAAKAEEREKEMDREREISLERRREEERERERRLLEHERHRFPSVDERSRERDRIRESEILAKHRSRSRSRSPMRNGRIDPVKTERGFERRSEDMNVLKIKEERRDSLSREEEILAARAADPFMHNSLMERARMLTPAAFLGADRGPAHHPSLWNPFDKTPSDIMNHRLGLQRELEQARDPFLNRLPAPGLPPGFPGFSPLEQERLREEMILRDNERAKRDYLERLPLMERERLYYENSKIPTLRPPDHLAHPFSRNISPAMNHIKRSSPSVGPGGPPPPLIHSGSSHGHRTHSSPVVNKSKGVSPIDSVGESKRDSNSNSTDPDAHSR